MVRAWNSLSEVDTGPTLKRSTCSSWVRVLALLVIALVPAAMGCGRARDAGTGGGGAAGGGGGLDGGGGGSGGDAGTKPVLAGFLDRAGMPPTRVDYATLGGWVVNIKWKDLEPTQGALSSLALKELDDSVAEVRAYNATHPTQTLGIKLRLFTGAFSPAWLMVAAGPTFKIQLNVGDPLTAIPRFWTPAFRDAHRSVMARLGARYDAVPEIRDVVVSRCSTLFMEPMVRETWLATNIQPYLDAGYTLALDGACQEEAIDDTATAWPTTRISESFSIYEAIQPDGTAQGSWDAGVYTTQRFMDYFRARLGSRGVWGNNEAGRGDTLNMVAPIQAVYAYEKAKPPVYYQTVAAGNAPPGDFESVIVEAANLSVSQSANYVELPLQYRAWADFGARFGSLAAALRANPAHP